MTEPAEEPWPSAKDHDTFEEYALSCSLWVERHPSAMLLKCASCENVVLFYDAMPPAKAPGHVYSDAGAREMKITHLCEWCFDLATAEPDEDGEQDYLSQEDFDKMWDEEGKS